MAVARVSESYASTATATLTVTCTVGSGNFGVFGITWRDTGETITGVTFNGSATGVTARYTPAADGNGMGVAIYEIAGVSGTAVSAVCTFNTAPLDAHGSVHEYSGVASLGTGSNASNAGGSSTLSTSVTAAADDMVAGFCHARADVSTTAEYTAPATRRTRGVNTGTHWSGNRAGAGGSTSIEADTGAGAENMRIAAIPVVASGGAATGRSKLIGGKLVGGILVKQ